MRLIAVYADGGGINLIYCGHGCAVPRIKVYVGLIKTVPAFTARLEKLGCAGALRAKP